ncbi:malectin domain-containing carbohydrate-binding protein [Nostoc sp. 106C]|uniref:malectin domain-containing carbohydrate-binding protein n=1 Tax=Nostoc sp. 106C TaxID=1932667 RepID=UPI000A36AA44|nr:malectin domain-containing carbohydrate-binding protein [Nostoc sp. 106C]OUL34331.1 hypothetical protein BV375_04780 [Nostoc sp. 106C]
MVAKASFIINPGSSNINTSTYNPGSFKITNDSTTGQKITKVLIDISSSILKDLVFDPDGVAGDVVAKNFTVDSEGGTGFASYQFLKAHDGGFDALEITFNSFDSGKTFTFSVDNDPTSIKGTQSPGPNESGSVSGLELLGSKVTVDFSDTTSYTAQTYRIPNSVGGSQIVLQANAPSPPTIQVLDLASSAPTTVSTANQTVRVSGTPGASVSLLVLEAGLFIANGGFDIDPYEANSVIAVNELSATIGSQGYVDVPVTLTRSHTNGGLNHIVAAIKNADGTTSSPSPVQVLEYNPNATPTAQVVVQQTGGNTAVTEGGATDSYSLVLNSQPTSNVTISLVTNTSRLNLDKTTLTFTPSNWNQTQTVSINAVDDAIVQGNQTVNITHTVNSTDNQYDNLAVPAIAVTVTDNDTTPTPTPMATIRIDAGATKSYTDSLGNLWSADQYFIGGNVYSTTAAIANTTDDPLYQTERYLKNLSYAIPVTNGDYTVNLKFAEIYFTGSGQRVFSVDAENQSVISNLDIFAQAGSNNTALDKSFNVKVNDGTLNLDFLASTNNAKIAAIEIIPVSTTPTAQVIVQQTGGNTAVTEGGATDSYSLALSSQPKANVTISLAAPGNQLSFDKTTLTFTPTNWNTAQVVTVTAVDDTAVEGTQTVNIAHTVSSTDSKYNNLAVGNVAVTITDNDTAPIPTGKAIRIDAGATKAYTDSQGNLWSADQYFINGSTYSTTAAIANTVDDPLYQTERYLKNLSYAIPVTNGDYTVNLKFAEIYFTAAGQRVFSVNAENQSVLSNLDIFAQAGSNTALDKAFNVKVNDGTLNLDFLASTNNAKIAAIEIIPVSTTPTAQVIVQQTGGNTAVTEGGTTDSYSLVLGSQPTANVTITLAAPGSQLSFDKTTLTFTPTNWNTAQTVSVAAVDDTAVEGTQTVNITHTVSSTDSKYNNLSTPNVGVTITDNDSGTPTVGAIRIDTGATKTYTDTKGQVWQADNYFVGTSSVYNTTAPIGKTEDDVIYQSDRFAKNLAYQIPVANGNYTVNLHFSENYWTDFNKRVFDVSLEGEKAFSNVDIFELSKNAFFTGNNSALVLSVPTQNVSDGVLNINLDASVDNATISGIEIVPLTAPQVILQQTGGNTAVTEGGASDNYSLVLNTKPTADVTVKLATSAANQITTNKTSFTFTPTNWNVAQTVTVNAVDDTLAEGAQTVNITHTVTSTDSNYNNLSTPQVAVNITDNDIVAVSFTQKTVATLSGHNPTTGAWGPDGRLYVASYDGEIRAYSFDQNYNVTNTQIINTIKNLSNSDILGIAFNPYDTSDSPSIYVAHTKLYGNGGGAFPDTELSAYTGEISILQGANFSQRTSLITGLPTSNHDHGVNGMSFDNNGDLYIGIGGNTNAGITNDNIGGIPESPLSAAILKAEISKPGFNGKIKYSLPSDFKPPSGITFDPATSQKFGDKATVQPGVDVSVYAAGLRNPYDSVFTTKGLLYSTDNGPNPGFGDVSTSATTQQPTYGDKDELNLIKQGQYYGHPNRNRGRTDTRQNVYHGTSEASIPGVYTAPLATSESSTDGIDEYRATTFAGQLRGHLLAQKWNQQLYDFTLSPDGSKVTKTNTYTGVTDGLDVVTGPGGAIVGIDYADSRVTVATPNDAAAIGVTAYDIFPWRAPANNDAGKNTFVIGGKNFGTLADTQVIIGGKAATLTEVTGQRIKGILPSFSNPNPNNLLDVIVSSHGQSSTIEGAYLPLPGYATFV